MINKIYNLVLNDRRIKLCAIVDAIGLSKGTVISILQYKLGLVKAVAH